MEPRNLWFVSGSALPCISYHKPSATVLCSLITSFMMVLDLTILWFIFINTLQCYSYKRGCRWTETNYGLASAASMMSGQHCWRRGLCWVLAHASHLGSAHHRSTVSPIYQLLRTSPIISSAMLAASTSPPPYSIPSVFLKSSLQTVTSTTAHHSISCRTHLASGIAYKLITNLLPSSFNLNSLTPTSHMYDLYYHCLWS